MTRCAPNTVVHDMKTLHRATISRHAMTSLSKTLLFLTGLLCLNTGLAADSLRDDVSALYDEKLKDLFLFFHQNPELSTMEHQTSARLADELESLGYSVHRSVGGTGIVALLENGEGPLVMFRADMDGLPLKRSPDCPTHRERAGRPQRQ